MIASQKKITFSFGRNWMAYLDNSSEHDISSALSDIKYWLGPDYVRGKTVLDIGSGSGIHSLSFVRLGAQRVVSFDYDPFSVEATRRTWKETGSPSNWRIEQGSILNHDFISSLGKFDIVYSWGVLHHTGSIWAAIESASNLVNESGVFWFSIYGKGPNYRQDLALKERYNASTEIGKRMMEARYIAGIMKRRLLNRQNPFSWNQKKARGMNVYNDVIDWLGGLPYEVASEDEIVKFLAARGMGLKRVKIFGEGCCDIYVFSRLSNDSPGPD